MMSVDSSRDRHVQIRRQKSLVLDVVDAASRETKYTIVFDDLPEASLSEAEALISIIDIEDNVVASVLMDPTGATPATVDIELPNHPAYVVPLRRLSPQSSTPPGSMNRFDYAPEDEFIESTAPGTYELLWYIPGGLRIEQVWSDVQCFSVSPV